MEKIASQNITVKLHGVPTTSQHISNHSALLHRKQKVEDNSAYQDDGAFHPLVFPDYGNTFCPRNVLSLFYFRQIYCQMSEEKIVSNKVLHLGVAKCS
jgi:hypothetical protein